MASRSSNRAEVPEAKEALDRFKMEVAQELGVPLSDGYNGNLTSAQNGSVGGYMVKNMSPERNMTFQRKLTHHKGAKTTSIEYHYTLVI
jgi:hypothetical protein